MFLLKSASVNYPIVLLFHAATLCSYVLFGAVAGIRNSILSLPFSSGCDVKIGFRSHKNCLYMLKEALMNTCILLVKRLAMISNSHKLIRKPKG